MRGKMSVWNISDKGIKGMGLEEYKYCAFISYRHVEPDRAQAMWLRRAVETFKVPKDLVAKGYPRKAGRVFRDEDELPASSDLGREILHALEQSEYLIVVCSPRVVTSIWCDAEVKEFRRLGRDDKIIALLIEGEPHEAFLPSLCEIRKHVINKKGETVEEIEDIEPLAADLRARAGQSRRETKDIAKLRILSCLLGCDFDELRKRELKRKHRIVRTFSIGLSLLALCLAGLTAWAFDQKGKADEAGQLAAKHASIAKDSAKTARLNLKISEERKNDLLREKIEVLKRDMDDAGQKHDHIKSVKLNLEAISILEELGEDTELLKQLLGIHLSKNRLRLSIPHNELSTICHRRT